MPKNRNDKPLDSVRTEESKPQVRYYLEQIDSIFTRLESSRDGLSAQESEKRLLTFGANKLRAAKKTPLILRFLKQLADPMIIILLVAAAISAVLAVTEKQFPADVMIILVVVLINTILGVYQESKAESAIAALQAMSAATSKVYRSGQLLQIKSEDLVPGDVIAIEAGDAIPADARLFECASLKIEEAALTGESVPVEKNEGILTANESGEISLGDRTNMVYMGSSAAYGRGKAVVVETGMHTEMGKIALAIEQAEDGQTPLQIKLTQLSKVLTWLVVGICVFIFGFNLIRTQLLTGSIGNLSDILNIFMIAVSLAVAAIPEGLAAVVTIVLSIGVTKMSKNQAIIRRLTAVETLGCASVICSDKTGTLTQNKMTVVENFCADERTLAAAMALCSDAEVNVGSEIHVASKNEKVEKPDEIADKSSECAETNAPLVVVGEPTEVALVQYALTMGLNKNELKAVEPRVAEAPFDSMRKMMSTIHTTAQTEETPYTQYIQYTKGAPDEILKHSTQLLTADGTRELTDDDRAVILGENKRMADKALRVLAAAVRTYNTLPASHAPQDLEQDLTFIGLVGMIDPVRPEVKSAIEECRGAGIRPIMITGDHLDTATAIAAELGILGEGLETITGAELEAMQDDEFDLRVANISVYARVQPEHKVRIVKAWRKRGCVTAMTGDGVNDAPAIKSADIGVGMGITGTDVTKNVADMMLADDNFATIVSAVGEGRRIYANIRKAIQFLLGSNLSEVLSIFISSLLGITILKPVHLLWINLVTDCFPALALGMEKPEHHIMKQQPRNAKAGIFSDGMGFDIFYQGVLVTILTLAAFFIGEWLQTGAWQFTNVLEEHGQEGMTMAFLTMNMAEIFHSFNMRSQRGSVFTMLRRRGPNWWLYGSLVLSFSLTCFALYVLPSAFGFSVLTGLHFAIALGLAFSVVPIVELVKCLQRLFAKAKKLKI
jgi:Ca2+-transporting ATPase